MTFCEKSKATRTDGHRYTIALAPGIGILAPYVDELMSGGWVPTGGVAFDEDEYAYQALTKPTTTD